MTGPLTPFERARRYLAKLEPAVSGSGGHNATFKAACKLVEFGLSESEALELMREFNATCQPPWSESDLAHKVRDAFHRAEPGKKLSERDRRMTYPAAPYRPTAPGPGAPPPQPAAKPATYDVAPVDLPAPIPNGAAELIRATFHQTERGAVRW